MRYNRSLPNLTTLADAESVVYDDDRNIADVRSNKGATVTANKMKSKYKKMRAKNIYLPFDLDEIEQAYTENYVDNTDIADANLKRNTAIAAKENQRKVQQDTTKKKKRSVNRTYRKTAKKGKNK